MVIVSSAFESFFAQTKPNSTDSALPSLLDRNTIAALPYWSFLQVAGPDSSKFLQGQLTCDIAGASETHATPGAHCTPKGRMQSSFWIARRDADTYWLRVRADIATSASAALGKYIVFSKAKISAQEQLLALGLNGPDAAATIKVFAGNLPTGINGVVRTPGGLIVQLDAAGQRFEAWLPEDEAIALWQSSKDFEAVNPDFWRWLDIRAELASVGAATVEAFIPQMLNYEQIGGISFTKGCYTGQEIVARTQYRGQVKRHLVRAEVAAAVPTPGSDIIGVDGRALGQVVDAVDRGDGNSELLIVVSGDENTRPSLYLQAAPPELLESESQKEDRSLQGAPELRVL